MLNDGIYGTCGGTNSFICKGLSFGDCCSSSGFCGKSDAHCKAGCQMAIGNCTASNISPDGTCGGSKGMTCTGSTFGNCCLSSGYCGSTTGHCTAGCQSSFGTCSSAAGTISTDGTCRGSKRLTCTGSSFSMCCSSAGYCGSSSAHCAKASGCQSDFNTCSLSTRGVSPHSTCGGTQKYTYASSAFGGCCSAGGYYRNTGTYCAQS
jgi:hypothetical protein